MRGCGKSVWWQQLDSLTDEELIAMQKMIFKDEAEIVSSAGKPYLMAKSERTIISKRRQSGARQGSPLSLHSKRQLTG